MYEAIYPPLHITDHEMTVFKKDLLNTNVPSIGKKQSQHLFTKKKEKKRNPEQNKSLKPKQTKSKNSVYSLERTFT